MKTEQKPPKLYIWKNSRLYIESKKVPFRKYTLAWNQLLVSIQGDIRIRQDDGSEVFTRSCLIKSGTFVNSELIDTSNAVIAIYYLNPISQHYLILQGLMATASNGINHTHPKEAYLVQQVRYISSESISTNQAYKLFHGTIIEPHLQHKIVKAFDPRIIETIQSIRETLSESLSIGDYAAEVYLSESRLKKLFKNQIGIPITKYRLQYRLSIGVILLALGYTVTDAAHGSGFSSSAHFSTCFSDMIGIQPSTPFLKPPYINAFISDEVLNAISSHTAR
jgi:AraC-like DNA-binding protein